MKLLNHFNDFLNETVNLNQTRINELKSRVESIIKTIDGFDVYNELLIDAKPQGSWAHRTIIKPAGIDGAFDADIVVFIKQHDKWTPEDYINHLYAQFKEHGTYRDKVIRKTRCVTIKYANEFSIDVVPCLRKGSSLCSTEWILNCKDNTEEQVNPNGYTKWFFQQNDCVGGNQLIKVIRLLKYLRDFKLTFSAKSILLTTLIGERVSPHDKARNEFSDTPTALQTLTKRLDVYLKQHPNMPEVSNPALPSESFTRNWDREKYENFRACISRYTQWIDDAYYENNQENSILKWRKVFGDKFAKSEPITKNSGITEAHIDDLRHVAAPPWRTFPGGRIEVNATLHSSKEGNYLGDYCSDGPALQHDTWIHFVAKHSFNNEIVIKWQIVNTGFAARAAKCLRGGFDHSGPDIWEHTAYRGKHWVECFAVNLKKNICLARSGRFYINIS